MTRTRRQTIYNLYGTSRVLFSSVNSRNRSFISEPARHRRCDGLLCSLRPDLGSVARSLRSCSAGGLDATRFFAFQYCLDCHLSAWRARNRASRPARVVVVSLSRIQPGRSPIGCTRRGLGAKVFRHAANSGGVFRAGIPGGVVAVSNSRSGRTASDCARNRSDSRDVLRPGLRTPEVSLLSGFSDRSRAAQAHCQRDGATRPLRLRP